MVLNRHHRDVVAFEVAGQSDDGAVAAQQRVLRRTQHGAVAGGCGGRGAKARDVHDLTRPAMDFVTLAAGLGLNASRAETAENFV
jgi:hypothetical protein